MIMKLKPVLTVTIVFFAGVQLKAQERPERANSVSDGVIIEYVNSAKGQAVVFSGKEQMPYDLNLTNHPYLLTSQYVPGELLHNHILYKEIPLRLDLYRDEIVTHMPAISFNIILEKEKVTEALISGYRIIRHEEGMWPDIPQGNYLILLNDGVYPVIKKYLVDLEQKIEDRAVEYKFRIRERFYVCKNGVCSEVSGKRKILKLFPDKKKELAAYIRQHKLNFRKEREQSIIAIVEYCETLNK
jgi:hypothetical protein